MDKMKLAESIYLFEKTLGRKIDYNEDSLLESIQVQRKSDPPLFIKVLSVFGGILGSLALMGFLMLAGLYESEVGITVLGALSITAAIIMSKSFNSLLPDTASVALYVVGYALLAYGLDSLHVGENLICFLFILIAVATAIVSNSFMLIFISILIVSGALLSFSFINEVFGLIHGHVALFTLLLTGYYLNEPQVMHRFPKLIKFNSAIKNGLVFSLIMGLVVVGIRGFNPVPYQYLWISSIVTILCTVVVLKKILNRFETVGKQRKLLLCLGCLVVLIPTSFSPAISGSLLLILLNYKINYRTGLFIGVIALIYFVSQFYYDLNYTLLFKSILMFVSGVIFMVFYYLLHKFSSNEEL